MTEKITLVAVERGFRNGRMVEVGTEFQFETTDAAGKPRKMPKWAKPKGDPSIAKAANVVKNGDLRPKDAQRASKGKQELLTGDLAG